MTSSFLLCSCDEDQQNLSLVECHAAAAQPGPGQRLDRRRRRRKYNVCHFDAVIDLAVDIRQVNLGFSKQQDQNNTVDRSINLNNQIK